MIIKKVKTHDLTCNRSAPKFRLLKNRDSDLFENFLKDHATTSMFMRSNARRSGLEFKPNQEYSANYWGAFNQDQLTGVLALNWNSTLMTQVPDAIALKKLYHFVLSNAQSNTLINGILGPDLQVQQVLTYLNPSSETISLSCLEVCYHLILQDMKQPHQLKEGTWHCRLATKQDLDVLIPWRIAYNIEALQIDPQKIDAFDIVQEELTRKIAQAEIFVLEDQGQCVAMADYNATLPEIYQIGGVWTPPEFRNRGCARAVTSGALQAAHHYGVKFGTLFTKNSAAIRAYESLGFRQVDDYRIILFKDPFAFKI